MSHEGWRNKKIQHMKYRVIQFLWDRVKNRLYQKYHEMRIKLYSKYETIFVKIHRIADFLY